uniref:Uncharacterized protein n=1 Tax=Rhizophora mucronata TaxID=61149 RepID=A0A2P2QY53_RHIMU
MIQFLASSLEGKGLHSESFHLIQKCYEIGLFTSPQLRITQQQNATGWQILICVILSFVFFVLFFAN